jgi:hypothetical protein
MLGTFISIILGSCFFTEAVLRAVATLALNKGIDNESF